MSIQEQRRARFEVYAQSIGYPTKTDNVGYCHPETTRLWQTWSAALDGVVIHLPEAYWHDEEGMWLVQRTATRKAVEDAGPKVAP